MTLCENNECTGCWACYNKCNNEAIKMIPNEEGFLHPKIDVSHCSECGSCRKICPVLNKTKPNTSFLSVYACWHINKEIRKDSSSGGFFTAISEYILSIGGIVWGAHIDNHQSVRHIHIRSTNELGKLRGSKYVQSEIENSYKEIKEQLLTEKKVLFTGTPCQVSGLRNFLGKEYENLYTCDFVCHGVPSPLVLKKYISYLETINHSTISSIKFRDKRYSWKWFNMRVKFQNNKIYQKGYFKDPFIIGFLRDYFNRPSCHMCQFANNKRYADITMGDFWGYKFHSAKCNDRDKGVSLVIPNNSKGELLLDKVQDKLHLFKSTAEDALKGNRCLNKPYPEPQNRNLFWDDFNKLDFEIIISKYLYPRSKLFLREKIESSISYNYRNFFLFPHKVYLFIKSKI